MAEGASPSISSKSSGSSFCDECGSKPWKYRCPGCSIRSCSLPCVNSHKKRTSCTGKRKHTEFVPLSLFDDNLLLADYRLLEETKRVADSARRKINGFGRFFGFRLPPKLWMLQKAARRRGIRLLFFPTGMSKRETNQSRYDRRKNTIFWTLELRFHGTGVVLLHHCVDERANMIDIFGKYLAPSPWNHKLRPFSDVQLDDLKLFLQKSPMDSKSQFRKLDIKAPIGPQLANIVIIEHPIIFIHLPSHEYDFQIEVARMPSLGNMVASNCDNGRPSHCGTLFRVEEVEEGDVSSDTRITDLIEIPENTNTPSNTMVANEVDKKENITIKHVPEGADGGFGQQLSVEARREISPSSPDSVDAVFYFDQEVRDAYSDLIGEMNPDDFLCFDGLHDDSVDLREPRWCDLEERKRDVELNGKLFDLEERQGNALKGGRVGDLEEKRENLFLSGGLPFGEMELEEGEIPCILY